MSETKTCVVPYNGDEHRVEVRVVDGKLQVRRPAAGWIGLKVLEERLGRKLELCDSMG